MQTSPFWIWTQLHCSIAQLKDCITKADFRGIAISAIISKVFEYCFIEKFGEFIGTDNKQFGFKKDGL